MRRFSSGITESRSPAPRAHGPGKRLLAGGSYNIEPANKLAFRDCGKGGLGRGRVGHVPARSPEAGGTDAADMLLLSSVSDSRCKCGPELFSCPNTSPELRRGSPGAWTSDIPAIMQTKRPVECLGALDGLFEPRYVRPSFPSQAVVRSTSEGTRAKNPKKAHRILARLTRPKLHPRFYAEQL